MLHTLVDKVFLITTINSERFDYISSHLKENDIQYQIVVAPNYEIITDKIKVLHSGDDTRPSVSLLSSFQSIIEMSRLCGYKKICVVEDDCFFVEKWQDLLITFLKNIPDDWDLLNVGYHPLHDTDTVKEKYNDYANIPLNYHHTTHCMMIKNSCYDEIINQFYRWNYNIPIDYIFNEIYKNNSYKSYIPTQKIAHQLSVRTTEYEISGVDLRFKSYLN